MSFAFGGYVPQHRVETPKPKADPALRMFVCRACEIGWWSQLPCWSCGADGVPINDLPGAERELFSTYGLPSWRAS